MPSKEVATKATDTTTAINPLLEDELTLQGIGSFADAMRVLEEAGIQPTLVGDGFYPLDKDSLVGVPFVVLANKEVNGSYGPMTVLHIVTDKPVKDSDGREVTKGLIVDGSTGIHEQAANYRRVGRTSGLICQKGLTRSDYEVDLPDPKTGELKSTPATTYYLS